jgi:hypothetical protein
LTPIRLRFTSPVRRVAEHELRRVIQKIDDSVLHLIRLAASSASQDAGPHLPVVGHRCAELQRTFRTATGTAKDLNRLGLHEYDPLPRIEIAGQANTERDVCKTVTAEKPTLPRIEASSARRRVESNRKVRMWRR